MVSPIKAPGHSVVSASAGSGKTFQLSNRYILLLLAGANPGTILATTFTRKAAGEIRERVLARLARGAMNRESASSLTDELGVSGSIEIDEIRRALRLITENLHKTAIGTLDSFFNRIAMTHRLEIGFPSEPRLLDNGDSEVIALRRRAISEMLDGGDLTSISGLVRELRSGGPKLAVAEFLEKIFTVLYARYRETRKDDWTRLLSKGKRANDDDWRSLSGELVRLAESASGKALPKRLNQDAEAVLSKDRIDMVGDGIVKNLLSGKSTYGRSEIPGEIQEAYERLVEHLIYEVYEFFDRQTRATWELLDQFHQRFDALKKERRIVLFDDLPLKLSRDLTSRPDGILDGIFFRTNAFVSHLLLDEFQDTSLIQWDTLRPLARQLVLAGEKGGEGSVFAVGDRKQSIYGWRGGCSSVFDQLTNDLRLDPSAHSTLTTNYRSSPVVLAAVNRLFSNISSSPAFSEFPEAAANWDNEFNAHTAQHDSRTGFVEIITAPLADNNANFADPVAAEAILMTKRLYERDRGDQIAVITSRNLMAQSILAGIRGLGIPASGEGGNLLTDEPAVGAILAALTLADHPGDSTSLFHLFHSPLANHLRIQSDSDVPGSGLNAGVISRRIRSELIANGYAAVIGEWSELLAPYCDRRAILRLERLIDLAYSFDARAGLRPGSFVELLETTPVEDPSSARVRVMTIHKAKGLEFDTVIFPCPRMKMAQVGRELLAVYRPTPSSPIEAVFRRPGKAFQGIFPQLDEANRQEIGRRLEDDLCALYVVTTRAKRALHIILNPLSRNKNGVSPLGSTDASWETLIRSQLRNHLDDDDKACEISESEDGGEVLYENGERDWRINSAAASRDGEQLDRRSADLPGAPIRVRLAGPGVNPRRNWSRVSPSSLENDGLINGSRLLRTDRDSSLSRGTILHEWFAKIDWIVDAGLSVGDDALREIAKRAECGVDDAQIEKLLEEFHAMILLPQTRAVFSAPRPAVPIAGGAESELQLWRERRFCVRSGASLLSGAFDRVLVTLVSGAPVSAELIDFKTDRLANKEEIADRIETYRPQIESYRGALETILKLPAEAISASLLFVQNGERIFL